MSFPRFAQRVCVSLCVFTVNWFDYVQAKQIKTAVGVNFERLKFIDSVEFRILCFGEIAFAPYFDCFARDGYSIGFIGFGNKSISIKSEMYFSMFRNSDSISVQMRRKNRTNKFEFSIFFLFTSCLHVVCAFALSKKQIFFFFNFKLSLGCRSFMLSVSISVGLIWHERQTYIRLWTGFRHESQPNKGSDIPSILVELFQIHTLSETTTTKTEADTVWDSKRAKERWH